jgi:hypothetical protein
MGEHERITTEPCTDPGAIQAVVEAANVLQVYGKTAITILTSVCPEDGHGTHVSVCVLNTTGEMSPSEARAACRRLRSLADELEQRFAPEGSAN